MSNIFNIICLLAWFWWLLYSIFGKDDTMTRIALFGASLTLVVECIARILGVME